MVLRGLANLIFTKDSSTEVRSPVQTPHPPTPNVSPIKSDAIQEKMAATADKITDPHLKLLFTNTFTNALETTVAFNGDDENPDTFIITGDIPAMWLRDSTNQVLPYMQFAKKDRNIRNMLVGLLNRQKTNIMSDPYANAYNYTDQAPNPSSAAKTDQSFKLVFNPDTKKYDQVDGVLNNRVWERKFEIDSLAAFLRLSWEFYDKLIKGTDEEAAYKIQQVPYDAAWIETLKAIYATAKQQMKGTDEEKMTQNGAYGYTFRRDSSEALDSLIKGVGNPAQRGVYLIKSGFRPSDDAQTFPYHIPGNAMFSYYLGKICSSSYFRKVAFVGHEELYNDCARMASSIQSAIDRHGIVTWNDKKILAYEIDGYGNAYLMDDANIPGLLSMPYYGYMDPDDALYKNTREFVLSSNNPYFYMSNTIPDAQLDFPPIEVTSPVKFAGLGGAHEWLDMIWPMGLIIQGLTGSGGDEQQKEELSYMLTQLVNSHAGTFCMHESFHKDDPTNYTRPWFSWANSLFGELIFYIEDEFPDLLEEQYCQGDHCTDNPTVPVKGCLNKPRV